VDEIACVLCGAEGRPWIEQDGWTLRRCDSCELLFVSPRPDAQLVAQLYIDDDAHISAGVHITRSNRRSARLNSEVAVRHIRKHKQKGRLLEIGPGGGSTLLTARRAGFAVFAYEVNPSQADYISERLGVPCAQDWE
jgi:hypothetical protein